MWKGEKTGDDNKSKVQNTLTIMGLLNHSVVTTQRDMKLFCCWLASLHGRPHPSTLNSVAFLRSLKPNKVRRSLFHNANPKELHTIFVRRLAINPKKKL